MRSLAGSALVLALLVSLLSGVGLAEQASAAEPDEIGAGEGSQPSSQPVSTDTICSTLASAAAQNDLPTDFFARLIWQESRFDPVAVSRAGAQGVAQFMPATANWRGLSNPFDPLEAIAQSAKLLRDLRREFGNLGLAAAAYNAGSGRVHDWLAGRRALPAETNAYVRIVTGYSPEQWAGAREDIGEMQSEKPVPCREIAGLVARIPRRRLRPCPGRARRSRRWPR
jgi:soluble lytic murein transglycosylase-like protein